MATEILYEPEPNGKPRWGVFKNEKKLGEAFSPEEAVELAVKPMHITTEAKNKKRTELLAQANERKSEYDAKNGAESISETSKPKEKKPTGSRSRTSNEGYTVLANGKATCPCGTEYADLNHAKYYHNKKHNKN